MKTSIKVLAAAVLALPLMACAEEKKAPPPPEPASLEDADPCFRVRDYPCAIRNYIGYLKIYPNDGNANARLAIARTRIGKHKESLVYYRKAIELNVVTYDLYAMYAKSLDATGDVDGAIAANRKALEIVPELVDVRGDLANQLARKGQHDEAIKLLEDFDKKLVRDGQSPYFRAHIATLKEQRKAKTGA